jgi:heptosyltransferase I
MSLGDSSPQFRREPPRVRGLNPEKILIIRPSALGDVCRTVPVLASLRRAFPASRIDWLVRDSFAPAIEHHPGLTSLIPFARTSMGTSLKRGRFAELRSLLARLREPRYDLVIDCQGLFRSGFFAFWSAAPVRIGYSNARELGWLGVNRRKHVDPGAHAVDRMLELVPLAGAEPTADMRLYTGWQERQWVRTMPPLQGRFAVIAPTSVWAGKRWPAERFADVARWLLSHGVDALALVGGPGEREQCAPLTELAQNEPRIIDLIGRTTVGQLMALIQASSLVIANDSAALHMAVGFNRPLIGLFGPTNVRKVGPYRRDADVIQHLRPGDRLAHKDESLGRDLMERITTPEVIERAQTLLSETKVSETNT